MQQPIEFSQGQTLLFIGDSITDCKHQERAYAPLGCGYVHFAANLLQASRPHLNLKLLNRGISGNTTRELLERWQADCINLQPDVVSIMIGINDLWRKYAAVPESRQRHVPPDEYQANLRRLLSQLQDECGSQVILLEPFMFCEDPANAMLADLPTYIDIVHQAADEFSALLVPLHTRYSQLTHKRPAEEWADDAVHPNPWAHAWIAQQWLESVIVRGLHHH